MVLLIGNRTGSVMLRLVSAQREGRRDSSICEAKEHLVGAV